MFRFIKNMFIGLLSTCWREVFGESLISNFDGHIKFVSLNNQPCQDRLTFVNLHSNETIFYQSVADFIKCGGSCNIVDDPYPWVCVPNKVKTANVKVFNLMLRVNEIRSLVHHESCEYKYGLSESLTNSKQKWNYDECRFECKELDNCGSFKWLYVKSLHVWL